MNQRQHSEIRELFLKALELEEAEVQEYITSSTNDKEVVKQVLSMLRTYETNQLKTQDFVNDVASNIANSSVLFPSDRYVLIEKIGQGGMGDVFLAQRKVEGIQQKVAIKILQLSDDFSKQRFSQETSILSRLSHPNISQFIDADFLIDGRPYVVIEYTPGSSITTYCEQHDLSLADRLSLFMKLCDAIHHAHRNLIIHRDIKPSNVLVTENGEVKLIDFGIAKFQQNDELKTVTEHHAMTPAYASPEQFTGQTVTVSSDVYSLGVILFELLCGERPLTSKNLTLVEYEKRLTTANLDNPSIRIGQKEATTELSALSFTSKWRKAVEGDLDKITIKALQVDTSQRYQTVAELIDDLHRYQNNLPVLAEEPSWSYRLRKFVVRNNYGVAAGVLFSSLVITFMSILLSQNNSIKEKANDLLVQKNLAIRDKQSSQALSDTLINAFKNADLVKTKGEQITARQILEQSVKLIKSNSVIDPKLRGQLILVIAKIHRKISETQKSLDLILSLEPELDQLDYDTRIRLLYEKALSLDALDQTESALDIMKDLVDQSEGENYLLSGLSFLYEKNGEFELAENILAKLYFNIPNDDPLFATVCTEYGDLLSFRDMQKEELGREVLHTCLEVSEKYPDNYSEWNKSAIHKALGHSYRMKEEYEKSLGYYKQVIDLYSVVFGKDHAKVARVYGYMATVLTKQEKFSEAMKYNLIFLDKYYEHFGAEHSYNAFPNSNLGDLYKGLKDFKKAEYYYLKAIQYYEDNGMNKHRNMSFFYLDLANLYLEFQKYEMAIDPLTKSREILSQPTIAEESQFKHTQMLLTQTYLRLDQEKQARLVFESSDQTVLEKHNLNDPLSIESMEISKALVEYFQ
ncbi:MAG: serine/threonine protein kinase [Arenicella sp.]|nr:serine/threonine protein kinase [Arenicella sp.]